MSYAAITRNAATEATRVHAKLAGMTDTAAGNVLYRGSPLVGVFSRPRSLEPDNLGGGTRPRVERVLEIPRTQLEGPPAVGEELVRTDLAKHLTYRIQTVDRDHPLFYVLELVRVGK